MAVLGRIGTVVGQVLWLGSTDEVWNDGQFQLTQVDLANWNPQSPLNYDAIYVDSNAGVPSSSQASAISDFVSAGGGLVTENGGDEGNADFGWVPNAGTAGFTWLSQNGDGTVFTPAGQLHPVTSGLVASELSNWHNVFPDGGNMDVLATTTAGVPNILADEYNTGRLVYLGHDADGHSDVTEAQRLIHQSLDWASQRDIEGDFYSFDLSAGDTADIQATSIAAGPGQFDNALLPSVRLEGPDGPVDPGSMSLSHMAIAGGTYFVEVLSANGAQGEYVLTVSVAQTPGITVSPTSGLTTTESGGSDQFDVVLNTQPSADVTIGLSSSDTGEGTVSLSSLTFDSSNWNTPQTVTVTGVDDGIEDGDVPYTIATASTVSADSDYNGIDPADVSVTNLDDDGSVPEMHVGDLDALASPANGGKWNATVTIAIHDADEGPVADATVLGSWSSGASGSSSCVTDASGTCSVTKNNVNRNSGSVTFTVNDVTHATNSYVPGGNHDPDGDSNGSSITIVKPAALNVAAGVSDPSAIGEILTDALLEQTVADAISLWTATDIPTRNLRVLDEIDVRVADLEGTLLAGAVPGMVVIDSDAAGHGWTTNPAASVDALSGGVDLLSAIVHEFGHILGFDHDLMGATLGVGVRDLEFLNDVAASSGSWTGVRRAGDVNADGRFDQRDLMAVLESGKYLSGQPAEWSEGDWNHDGFFDQLDIVHILQRDGYAFLEDVDSVFEQLSS